MSWTTGTVEVRGLGKRQAAQVAERAKRLGMTPSRYVKHLVEEDLAISQEARNTSFNDLMGTDGTIDEAQADRLVEAAKARHHRRIATRK